MIKKIPKKRGYNAKRGKKTKILAKKN